MTLTVDLENQGQTPFLVTFLISGCIHDKNLILVSILTESRSIIPKKNKVSHMTLTIDLENQGQTSFLVTFLISGCIHDINLILVSILTNLKSVISKKTKLVT